MTPEEKDERQKFIDGLALAMQEAGADVETSENGLVIKFDLVDMNGEDDN